MSIRPGDTVGDREKTHHGRSSGGAASNTHVDDIHGKSAEGLPEKATPGFVDVASGAIAGTASEKRMGIVQGFRTYPKAVGWSVLLSTAIIMEGYDVTLLPNLFAFPPFEQKYGQPAGPGKWELTPAWQAGLVNGANVGEIIGLFITGIVAERLGYRRTMIGALFLVICLIFIAFFAQNVQMLLAAEILCGIPWGVFQTREYLFPSKTHPTDDS